MSRQVVVNQRALEQLGVPGSLTAILAHEVGHHVAFPHTLGQMAHLEVLQRRLLPSWPHSLVNLFYDLLVNEHVGREWPEELAAVYRAATAERPPSPPMAFLLGAYEELWGLPILHPAGIAVLDEGFPLWRNEARIFAQTFWTLGDVFLQFVYFCARISRYLRGSDANAPAMPMSSDLPLPSPGDLAEAIRGNPLVERALAQGKAEGWLNHGSAEANPHGGLGDLDKVSAGWPGRGGAPFRRQVANLVYQRLVDEHLIKLPDGDDPNGPEPSLPTTLEDWEFGDDPRQVDWTASVLRSGPLAAAMPLRRDQEVDARDESVPEAPSVEIYLDTSGSMPDPSRGLNAMTLGAQVLAAATLRKGGRVRACVYSSGPPYVTDWIRDEAKARDELMTYAGGGTEFPFDRLKAWSEEEAGVIRILITDADFIYNVGGRADAAAILDGAAARSRPLVGMFSTGGWSGEQFSHLFAPLRHQDQIRLVFVEQPGDFGAMAARLAEALLEGR